MINTREKENISFMEKEKKVRPEWAVVGAHLKKFRESKGMSQADFSKAIPKLWSSNMSMIENGERRLTTDMLRAICDRYKAAPEEVTGISGGFAGFTAQLDARMIPVINEAQAGEWLDAGDLDYPAGMADRYLPSRSNDQNAFFIIVRGTSMIGGDIKPGDALLIEPNKRVEDGSVVLACGPPGKTIKRFKKTDNRIILSPMNPDFETLLVAAKDAKDYRFYKVVQLVRKLG